MTAIANPDSVYSGLVLCIDGGNPKSYSTNTFPSPTDPFGYLGSGGANSANVSRDTTISLSPAGGIPFKMAVTGNDPYTATYASTAWSFATAANGQTWTVSAWIRASNNTTGGFYIFGANSAGSYIELWNPMWSITTEWQRFSYTFTYSNANTVAIQIRLEGPDTGGTGINLWWDGIQVEKQSAVTNFNPVYNNNAITSYDISGNSNNGTLTNNPTYNTSNLGIFNFDGVDDSIIVPNSSSLKNQNITIDMAFKNNGTLSGDIIQFGVGSGSYAQYYFRSVSGNTYWDWFPTGTAFYGEAAVSNSTYFPTGTWKNVILTGTSDGTVQMFINGVSVGGPVRNATSSVSTWTPANLTIGGFTWDGYTNTSFGYVRIYNTVLSASQIQQNFNAFRGRYGI